MNLDPNEPTSEVLELCACPVDWRGISGFGNECPSALELLQLEWIRCVAEVSVSGEEPRAIEDVLFDWHPYELPHSSTLVNLKERRQLAVDKYINGIGRLGYIKFLRPSEHGKHFSVSGSTQGVEKRSIFYTDLERKTLEGLFWHWFDDILSLDGEIIPPRTGPFPFLLGTEELWDTLKACRKIRIAMDTTATIGELNGSPLQCVAIDIDFGGGIAHAYPVSSQEAVKIMGRFPLRQIKSHQY